jgi:hypothetical protein
LAGIKGHVGHRHAAGGETRNGSRFGPPRRRYTVFLMVGDVAGSICQDCGLHAAPGEPGCAEIRDWLLARDFEQPVLYWRHHRLAIDAYCVQHAAYVDSAKSLAAHLCGLCIAFEMGNDETAMRSLQQWLSTNPDLRKPALPKARGHLTIKHVHGLADPLTYGAAVQEWARSAWDAYRDLHPAAREWLSHSHSTPRRRR